MAFPVLGTLSGSQSPHLHIPPRREAEDAPVGRPAGGDYDLSIGPESSPNPLESIPVEFGVEVVQQEEWVSIGLGKKAPLGGDKEEPNRLQFTGRSRLSQLTITPKKAQRVAMGANEDSPKVEFAAGHLAQGGETTLGGWLLN
jgi:hypothetical protein